VGFSKFSFFLDDVPLTNGFTRLVLNTAVSDIVPAKERTAVFGRLQGSIMLGTAFGFLCKLSSFMHSIVFEVR
jgi:hypothetical protein